MTTDKEHLQWIHNRIVEVYGESENVDFLHRMRKIIDKQDTELNLHSVSHQRELLIKYQNWYWKEVQGKPYQTTANDIVDSFDE